MAGTPVLGSEGVPLLVTGDAPWLATGAPVLGLRGFPCWQWGLILSGTALVLAESATRGLLDTGTEELPHLTDAEEAGHCGNGVVQVLLQGVLTEHVV